MKTPAGRYTGSTRYYLIGVLVALELLMSFSFLGYIHIEPISVTFAYIPVLLAALLGVPEAAALGFVFGVASMWKAGAHYVAPVDQLFSPFMSGAPVESILLSVGTRTLFGVIVGVLCLAIKRTRHPNIGIALISFFGAEIHSILVYGAMGLLFPETGYTAATAFRSFFTLQDIVSNLVTMYMHMEARQDVLTGVFTRRFFFRMCEQALKQHVFTSNAHGYGAVPIGGKKTVQEYYQSADQVLYQAKKQGRDQYIIRATTE